MYLQIPETEFDELASEFCKDREPITGYCLDPETDTSGFQKMDPLVIYFLIGMVGVTSVYNSKMIFNEYSKVKRGYRETWDDEFKK